MDYSAIAFTTTNKSRPLYRRDALNALSYPRGWRLSLTYRGRWVEHALWNKSLERQRVLFVLCCNPSETTGEFGAFVPLRFGTVTNARADGQRSNDSVLSLGLSLEARPSGAVVKGFAALPLLRTAGPKVTGDSVFLRSVKSLKEDFQRLTPFGALAPHVPIDDDDEMEWGLHVDHLVDACNDMHSSRFMRLADFRELLPARRPQWCRRIGWSRGGYPRILPGGSGELTLLSLEAGKGYQLDFQVHSRTVESNSGVPIRLDVAGAHVEIATPVMTQHGSDALVSYLLLTQRKYAPDTVSFTARSVDSDTKVAPIGQGPEFQVLFRISPPSLFWLFTIVTFAAGTAFLSMDKAAFESLCFTYAPWWAVGAKVLGGLLIAQATRYAFNKLPIRV